MSSSKHSGDGYHFLLYLNLSSSISPLVESDFALFKKGLDGVLGPHLHLKEDYKFQVLLDHLKLPAAFQIAK